MLLLNCYGQIAYFEHRMRGNGLKSHGYCKKDSAFTRETCGCVRHKRRKPSSRRRCLRRELLPRRMHDSLRHVVYSTIVEIDVRHDELASGSGIVLEDRLAALDFLFFCVRRIGVDASALARDSAPSPVAFPIPVVGVGYKKPRKREDLPHLVGRSGVLSKRVFFESKVVRLVGASAKVKLGLEHRRPYCSFDMSSLAQVGAVCTHRPRAILYLYPHPPNMLPFRVCKGLPAHHRSPSFQHISPWV